jgi:hypothetical protein
VKIAFAVIVVILGGIIMSFTNIDLPLTAQRALCFLPGNWDPNAVSDAKDSSEWRFEMWEIALTSDKYIHNKIFGDGFGFLRQDYERSLSMMAGYSSLRGDEVRQEMFLLDGDYHSGPVGTIRFVGCVGLVLFLMLLYFVIRMAWRMIDSSQGTEYENVTLFLFIPIIVMPFYFIFVYGDYRTDFVAVLFSAGMLKVLGRSIAESKMA